MVLFGINLSTTSALPFQLRAACSSEISMMVPNGIVFVVQNRCLVAGTSGGGIGYQNFPGYSLGVEFDTYQNVGAPSNDPAFDHVAILRDGSIDHATNLAGPVQTHPTLANVEE